MRTYSLTGGLFVAVLSVIFSLVFALLSSILPGKHPRNIGLGDDKGPATVLALTVAALCTRLLPSASQYTSLDWLGCLALAAYMRCIISSRIDTSCVQESSELPVTCHVLFQL